MPTETQRKIKEAKEIVEELNKLDAHYLTGHPSNMQRKDYVKKRSILKKKFEKLKKSIT